MSNEMINVNVPAECIDAINEILNKANKRAERAAAVVSLFDAPMNNLLERYGFFTVPMLMNEAKELGANFSDPDQPNYLYVSANDIHAGLKGIEDIDFVRCSPNSDSSMKIYFKR